MGSDVVLLDREEEQEDTTMAGGELWATRQNFYVELEANCTLGFVRALGIISAGHLDIGHSFGRLLVTYPGAKRPRCL